MNNAEFQKKLNDAWIELIKKSQIEFYVAFIPVFEGTIVTFLKK